MSINPNVMFPTKTNAPSGGYPYGSARNVAAPGDGTGTPWDENILNDWFGFQAELFDKSGIVPSGNPDEKDVSDLYDAVRLTSGFPGTMVPIGLNDDPSVFGLRILICDGSGILIANYPDLVANTYVGDADNEEVAASGALASFYKSLDETGAFPDIAGPYFQIPDQRGQVLRAMDDGILIDPDAATRYLGSIQWGKFREHGHKISEAITGGTLTAQLKAADFTGTPNVSSVWFAPTGGTEAYAAQDLIEHSPIVGVLDNPTAIDETRATNSSVRFGIWY